MKRRVFAIPMCVKSGGSHTHKHAHAYTHTHCPIHTLAHSFVRSFVHPFAYTCRHLTTSNIWVPPKICLRQLAAGLIRQFNLAFWSDSIVLIVYMSWSVVYNETRACVVFYEIAKKSNLTIHTRTRVSIDFYLVCSKNNRRIYHRIICNSLVLCIQSNIWRVHSIFALFSFNILKSENCKSDILNYRAFVIEINKNKQTSGEEFKSNLWKSKKAVIIVE